MLWTGKLSVLLVCFVLLKLQPRLHRFQHRIVERIRAAVNPGVAFRGCGASLLNPRSVSAWTDESFVGFISTLCRAPHPRTMAARTIEWHLLGIGARWSDPDALGGPGEV